MTKLNEAQFLEIAKKINRSKLKTKAYYARKFHVSVHTIHAIISKMRRHKIYIPYHKANKYTFQNIVDGWKISHPELFVKGGLKNGNPPIQRRSIRSNRKAHKATL